MGRSVEKREDEGREDSLGSFDERTRRYQPARLITRSSFEQTSGRVSNNVSSSVYFPPFLPGDAFLASFHVRASRKSDVDGAAITRSSTNSQLDGKRTFNRRVFAIPSSSERPWRFRRRSIICHNRIFRCIRMIHRFLACIVYTSSIDVNLPLLRLISNYKFCSSRL